MDRNTRDSVFYREVETYFRSIHAPADGLTSDAANICVEPRGRRAAVSGTDFETLAAPSMTKLCVIDLRSGDMTRLPCPQNNYHLPLWSPDCRKVLLGVAGYGADLAGRQGGATIPVKATGMPD